MDFRNLSGRSRAMLAGLMVLGTAFGVTGCDSGGSSDSSGTVAGGTAGGGTGGTTGTTPPPVTTTSPPPITSTRSFTTDVMVFTGAGTWSTEITDAEALLTANGASYQEVNSAQLDVMTPADMAAFGVIFIPGGTGSTEADSVSATTHANMRTAVQTLGVSYVGFCAGAFVAVAPAPTAGGDVSYGFGVVDGAVENEYAGPGTTADYFSVVLNFTSGGSENILWYGGPITPNTGVLATYPTGDPAISQIWSGTGLVLIAGVHPDLSTSSLSSLGATPTTSAQDTAWKMFNAAITQVPITTL
jgi:glutamine amidotransferase-like uncharacterized protein